MKKIVLLSLFVFSFSFAKNNKIEKQEQQAETKNTITESVMGDNLGNIYNMCVNEANGVRNSEILNGATIAAANSAYYSSLFGCMLRESRNIDLSIR